MQNHTIKKFIFSIGGFPGPSYSIEYKNGIFAYRAEPKYNDDLLLHNDSTSADLEISAKRVDRFYNYIRRYCKHWKKKYSIGPVCDGTYWECDIKIDDFSLRSSGHVAYPGNFDTFLHKLTILTNGKIFE